MTSFLRHQLEVKFAIETDTSGSFIQACYDGDSTKVEEYLRAGVDPDTLVQDGLTVIQMVCYKWSKELLLQIDSKCDNYYSVFTLLLQYGAELDLCATTTSGVFGSPSPTCLILLVGMFRNVLEKVEVYGYPVYSEYCQIDFPYLKWIDITYQCVLETLENGADVNAVDGEGNTALHVLLDPNFTLWRSQKIWNIAQQLINLGADVLLKNGQGDTPFHLAMKKLKSSIELECRNYSFCHGQTVTGWKQTLSEITDSLNETYIKCVDILTSTSQYNMEIRNNKGKSVLHCAVMSGSSAKLLKKLFQLGANPNCKDNNGILPFLNQSAINLIPAENPHILELLTLNVEAGFNLTEIPRQFLFHIGCYAWTNRNADVLKLLHLYNGSSDILEYARDCNIEKTDDFYVYISNFTKTTTSLFDIVVIFLRQTLKPNTLKGLNDLIAHGVLPIQIKHRLIS